jgi:hypothetical protein
VAIGRPTRTVAALMAGACLGALAGCGDAGERAATTDAVASCPEPRRAPAERLSWAPPELERPETITPRTAGEFLQLDPERDYVVRLGDEPFVGRGGLAIEGGRNVVVMGGEVVIPRQPRDSPSDDRRGLRLKGQTGTVHVEGLWLRGDLTEGIDIDQRKGAVVQLQNIRVETVRARDERNFSDNHPDVVQVWAGPAQLRIDRLTGSSDYQGLFIVPNDEGTQPPPCRVDIRRVNIHGTPTARYLLWKAGDFPLSVQDVWIEPPRYRSMESSSWPERARVWRSVRRGLPPGGDFVPRGVAGRDYRSPGYGG